MTARLLINTANELTATTYVDGTLTDPSPSATATVTITADDGTVIDTDAEATRSDTGTFNYTLAARSAVDLLTATWTVSFESLATTLTTYVELVGGYYATIEEIQADTSLSSYTTAQLEAARMEAEDEAERIMGRAFVSRYRRDRNLRVGDDGCVRTRMAHVTALRAISATAWGDAYTISTTDCRIVGDDLVWTGLPCGSLVSLAYTHGGLEPVPTEVREKGILVRARQIAQRAAQAVPSSTDSYTLTDYGVIKLSQPTTDSTGVAIADAVYRNYSLRVGIA